MRGGGYVICFNELKAMSGSQRIRNRTLARTTRPENHEYRLHFGNGFAGAD